MMKLARLLSRLLRDRRANTLALGAAALIPLVAMIGSAVDISRAYMAKNRLQSACDASSLAARRVMKLDVLDDNVIQTGEKYFEVNFPEGKFGTAEFDPEITKPEVGVIRVTASTSIPNVFMKIFGYDNIPLNVDCDASLNFVNTDVVLVLDVTGSMDDPVGGVKKIQALREAVMALYDELEPVQEQLQSQGLRLRYGIVPYSSNVNVGRLLYAADPDYLRTKSTYPSRVANFTQAVSVVDTVTTSGAWEYYNGSSSTGSSSPTSTTTSSSTCSTWVGGTNSSTPRTSGTSPSPTYKYTYGGSATNSAYSAATNWGWDGSGTSSSKKCRRWKVTETTTYLSRYKFKDWTYKDSEYDVSEYIQPGGTILLANNNTGTVAANKSYNAQELAAASTGGSNSSFSWNGCIEERQTTTSINGGTSLTIPSDAYDLNINLIPNSDATRWRPQLAEVVYRRTAGSTSATSGTWVKSQDEVNWACPAESRRLDEWTREEMDTYVSGLVPVGYTYHDIGMIWGARMISTGGVFADGCEEYNEMPCNRHIIFMTDGAQTASCSALTAYGVEQNDRRVTGSGSCPSQLARHQQRFRMACNAAKGMDVSVWVIGFDTSLNSNLTGCASNAAQATTSSDSESLIERFRQIGNLIGSLRLIN